MVERAPRLSVVVPIFNEVACIDPLVGALRSLMAEVEGGVEVVLVDDGSVDGTDEMIDAVAAEDPRFRAVHLSRNFGHQVALTAGLAESRGAAVVTMDADLQHPPHVVLQMLRHWEAGFDVVYGVMRARSSESSFKRWSSDTFYWGLERMTDVHMPPNVGDFRLLDRAVVDAFLAMPERNRYIRGMFAWMGFRQIGIEYDCAPRVAGRTSYSLTKMIRLGLNAVFGFSAVPLRLILALGLAVSLLGFGTAVASVVSELSGRTVPGWTSIVVVTCLLGGVQLVVLGVIGEYIGRVYDEVRQRPLYLVRQNRTSRSSTDSSNASVSSARGPSERRLP